MQTYCLTPKLLIYDIVDYKQVHMFGMWHTRWLSISLRSICGSILFAFTSISKIGVHFCCYHRFYLTFIYSPITLFNGYSQRFFCTFHGYGSIYSAMKNWQYARCIAYWIIRLFGFLENVQF